MSPVTQWSYLPTRSRLGRPRRLELGGVPVPGGLVAVPSTTDALRRRQSVTGHLRIDGEEYNERSPASRSTVRDPVTPRPSAKSGPRSGGTMDREPGDLPAGADVGLDEYLRRRRRETGLLGRDRRAVAAATNANIARALVTIPPDSAQVKRARPTSVAAPPPRRRGRPVHLTAARAQHVGVRPRLERPAPRSSPLARGDTAPAPANLVTHGSQEELLGEPHDRTGQSMPSAVTQETHAADTAGRPRSRSGP